MATTISLAARAMTGWSAAVDRDQIRQVAVMNPVNPNARKLSKRGEVVIAGE
jgi:hypothetical protein